MNFSGRMLPMVNKPIDDCRTAFEKDAEPYGYDLERAKCGCCTYERETTEHRWQGWQAAWVYLDIVLSIDGEKI